MSKETPHPKDQSSASSSLQDQLQELEDELQQSRQALTQYRENASSDLESELKDLKSKLRVMTTKFANVRKERDQLKKENVSLETEVMELQSNMRQMVPGLQNTSSTFPMINELGQLTDQYYKCDCQDFFFEVLSPELSLDGIVYFFKTHFVCMKDMVRTYFSSAETQLKLVSSLESLEGPIMNVLRKSYQARWKSLYERVKQTGTIKRTVQEVQSLLQLGGNSKEAVSMIESFSEKMGQLQFCYYIADPPLTCLSESVGDQVEFNGLLHEPLDGFVRPGDPCIVILPATYKACGELLNKAGVLHVEYQVNG